MRGKSIFILIMIAAFCSSGCSNYYRDINKTLLITAMLVDVGEDGGPKIYFEGFRPERTAGKDKKETRVIFIISGKTVAEVNSSLNTIVSNKANFSHNKVILFSKKAAEMGLERYIDLFARDQEYLLRSNVAIYDGKPEELFNARLPGDQFLGLHCFDLFRNDNNKSAQLTEAKVQNLFNGRYEFGGISVLPILMITQHMDKLIAVNGAAVLHDFKLVAVLSREEVSDYNLFQNKIPLTIYTMENPLVSDRYISLRSVDSNITTKINYDGTTVLLTKKIELDVNFIEAQEKNSLTMEQRELLTINLTEKLQREWREFFEKYKARSVDLFNVEEMFRRKYPHEKLENPLGKTLLKLEIKINMEGSGNDKEFN